MRFNIKILESENEIRLMIMKALLPSCDEFMTDVISGIKAELPNIISNAVLSRPEYMSLINGTLRLELGIPDASVKVANMINVWISNIVYTYTKPSIVGNKIKTSFSAQLIKSDFSDILGLPEATVADTARGYNLPWFQWLVLDGLKTIVPNHNVVFGPNRRSRTGGAIMRVSSNGWRVPAEFKGTITDNWITRAIDDAESEIKNLLTRELT